MCILYLPATIQLLLDVLLAWSPGRGAAPGSEQGAELSSAEQKIKATALQVSFSLAKLW